MLTGAEEEFISQGPKSALNLWERLWINGEQFVKTASVVRGENPVLDVDVPTSCLAMEGHEFIPGVNQVLVRAEYQAAFSSLVKFEKMYASAVLVGHPGIGAFIVRSDQEAS